MKDYGNQLAKYKEPNKKEEDDANRKTPDKTEGLEANIHNSAYTMQDQDNISQNNEGGTEKGKDNTKLVQPSLRKLDV